MEFKTNFSISGKVVSIGETQVFASGFSKREVVIDTSNSDKFPSPVKVTLKRDECAKADAVGVGDGVTATGWVEGRRFDGAKGTSYFVDLAVKTLTITEKVAAGTPANGKAVDWKTLLELGKALGETEEEIKKRCEAHKAKVNRRFTAEDYQAVADQLSHDHLGGGVTVVDNPPDDDMPF